ncbi:hypothetical protein [Hymenobacter sp.]
MATPELAAAKQRSIRALAFSWFCVEEANPALATGAAPVAAPTP